MNTSITVSNGNRSEFDFTNLDIQSKRNIIIHCVYDPFNHFETEFEFLLNPKLDANTLVILWHPVEQGFFEPTWMAKLDAIVEVAPYKLVYLTGCSHKPNIYTVFPHKFDIKFFPIFDIRSGEIFSTPQPIEVDKKYPFMCINAKDAPNRRYVLGTLIKNNLLDLGVVSYQCKGGKCQVEHDFNIHRAFSNEQLEYTQSLFDLTDPYLPIKIDDSDIANGLPRDLFLQSYLGIIGETHSVNIPWGFNTSFVTEKTFNAIANNQMFIIVGQAGSLDLLHSLGYKTFDGIINESYDTIMHNGNRLEAVAKEIVRFVSRPLAEIREDYIKVLDIIEHNKKLLYNQNFSQRLQSLINQYA